MALSIMIGSGKFLYHVHEQAIDALSYMNVRLFRISSEDEIEQALQ
jgi:hypothetical protein